MSQVPYSIVITGEWPGSGQSTTASKLAKRLGFERVYAGFLFRKFAYVWNIEKNHLSWEEFESGFVSNKIKLDDYQFTESDFNEKILHQWQQQLKQVNTPDLWDKIIDRHSLLALEKPSVIVEAKVGVLLDKTGLVSSFKPKHKIFKFLLVCPPEISAHRVIKRKIENGEMPPVERHTEAYKELIRETTTETINRQLRDWERYEIIYKIRRSDIYKHGVIKIYTAEKTEDEVVETIIEAINLKLEKY